MKKRLSENEPSNIYTQLSRKKFDDEEKDIDYAFSVPKISDESEKKGSIYHPLLETYLYIADELIPELSEIVTPLQGLQYLQPKLFLENKKYKQMMKGNKRSVVRAPS